MKADTTIDVLILGSGPAALSIAASLCEESLKVAILSPNSEKEPWPYTYGVWGKEVDEFGLGHLIEHRWSNTVSYFGVGSSENQGLQNKQTIHNQDYGLFDKRKLQNYWLNQCKKGKFSWHQGLAKELDINLIRSSVETSEGENLDARLIIDATGYDPIFLQSKRCDPIAIQTCYGVVGNFNKPPVDRNQFVLMDYRCDHLSKKEREEPPTFLYAMDLGNGKFFLEETSLGLAPPVSLEKLKQRLMQRLEHRGLRMTKLEHEELGLYLPMNLPLPNLNQEILGFGGAAGMVHPASGYMVGGLIRRAPSLAKTIAQVMEDKSTSPAIIAKKGWLTLWPPELRRKQALYQFGLEKLMRFKESQLRDFFKSFFELPRDKWYGFLTNTITLEELIKSMWKMFLNSPWNVRLGLIEMKGREMKLLWNFIKPNI